MRKFIRKTRGRLEKTLLDNPRLVAAVTDRLERRIRASHDSIDWIIVGKEALAAELQSGRPVIMVLWHGRLAMAPTGWDNSWGELCIVTSSSRPGKLVGEVMKRFGNSTLAMSSRKSNTTTSLQVARMTRDGTSIGFAIDGSSGPRRVAKSVPIDWARMTGMPIWLYTNSFESYRTLPLWDRMAVPKAGTRGCMLYRRWDAEVPRRLDTETRESLRARLQADLDALTLDADRMMGHAGFIN
ncbi:lysophospholipid acyltransferase family protein [Tropicimonas sp.]|uniref:lysophospholipid acyltransferase family protein n=1 Tax=Tropicimonas sp. TaxID=2067044 RepID=UPI003A897ADD